HFAGLRLDREASVGPRHSPTNCSALCLRCGTGAARPVIHKVEIGIVGEKTPNAGHPALLKRRAAPGVVPGLTGPRDHLVAPDLLAVSDIVASHVASEASHLTGAPRADNAIHDDRPAGILDEKVAPAIALPDPPTRASVQPDDEIVPRRENN